MALNPVEWILPEDMPSVSLHLNRLDLGDSDQETFDFRTRFFGELRYLRVMFRKDPTSSKSIFIGAVQDITEIMRNSVKLKESQELWELAINAIPSFFFVKDANNSFRYLLCNKAYADFIGHTESEIIGKNDFDLTNDTKTAGHYLETDEKVMAGSDGIVVRESIRGPDVTMRLFQTSKKPFFGLGGNRLLIGVGSDITEMSNMVRRLNTLVSNQKVVSDSLSILIGESDPHHAMCKSLAIIGQHTKAARCYIFQFDTIRKTITCFSEYAADGIEPIKDQIVNRPYFAGNNWEERFKTEESIIIPEVRGNEEREGLTEWTEHILRNDVRSIYAHRIIVNGRFWGYIGLSFQSNVREFSPEDADFLRASAHCAELLIIRMMYREKLIEAIEKSLNAEKAKSVFLASMSHEIRTPLNAVIGFSELLQSGDQSDEDRKDYLRCISSAGNALLALINDVLDISKLEAGQMSFKAEKCDFDEIVTDVGNIFRQKCAERRLNLVKQIPDGFPFVWVDKLRIRQILFNLIGNAVKFTESGSIIVKAQYEKKNEKYCALTFTVTDSGIGISEEDQKLLFQPFSQARALRGTQTAKNGTGLGLVICRRMAEYMDGSLSLQSRPGKGSSFTVTLNHVRYAEREFPASSDGKSDATTTDTIIRRKTVMLVDDVAMNLKVMDAILRELGVVPVTASNAEDAFVKLEMKPVDFIITDLWMPGMNGADFAAKVRRDRRFAETRIAVVTADAENGENFDMSVFDNIMLKPVSIDKLRNLLSSEG